MLAMPEIMGTTSREAAGFAGRIEIIWGCMFSGKTERLCERLERIRASGGTFLAFKHAADVRYAQAELASHNGRRVPAVAVRNAGEILSLVGDTRLVAIDEGQFFDGGLIPVCAELKRRGCEVVVAGLDKDSWAMPFGPMPELAEMADVVTRTHAVCAVCGREANFTQRLSPVEGSRMVGGAESYQPRCGECFRPPPLALRC